MGRKSFKEEIQITKYLTALSEPTFKFITAMYETGDKKDKQWATEQMVKLYGKAIPQAGDTPDNPIFQQQITGMRIIDGRTETSEGDPIPEQEPQTA